MKLYENIKNRRKELGLTQNGIGAAIYTHFDIDEIRKELDKLKV